MANRGYKLAHYQSDDGTPLDPFLWKRCEIEGCPNLICEQRSPRFCWPHSPGGGTELDAIGFEEEGVIPSEVLENVNV